MEGERLMAIAAIQNVRDVLAAYPGLADLAVLTHEQESVGQVLVAYVVPGSPGLNMAALHKYARRSCAAARCRPPSWWSTPSR